MTLELIRKDLEAMLKRKAKTARKLEHCARTAQGRMMQAELETLSSACEWLQQGRQLRHRVWNSTEQSFLRTMQTWTSKPVPAHSTETHRPVHRRCVPFVSVRSVA